MKQHNMKCGYNIVHLGNYCILRVSYKSHGSFTKGPLLQLTRTVFLIGLCNNTHFIYGKYIYFVRSCRIVIGSVPVIHFIV